VDPRRRKYIIIISIALHILFFLLWEIGVNWGFIGLTVPPESAKKTDPIVFDLQQPQQERPKEVIETPDDAKVVEKQKQADFLSDKNALARNQEPAPDNLKVGESFSRGDFDSHELPKPQLQPGQKAPPLVKGDANRDKKGKRKQEKPEEEPEITEDLTANVVEKKYAPENEQEMKKAQPIPPGAQRRIPTVTHDNTTSRALDSGGLSFNTYNWDYAPYMLMLKQKISRNIFPPVAFTHLGLIQGQTLLRFRIYPDGRMTELKILGYNGHKTLVETSYNAVDVSAPFPPLPKNFPEPFLEVTGKFIYFVRR
jgi:outer membrane biosynthesis protein TonB